MWINKQTLYAALLLIIFVALHGCGGNLGSGNENNTGSLSGRAK
jgi:hypothetical protein